MENQMQLITTFRFKTGEQYIGIVGYKDPQIRTTPFHQHAVHHFDTEFDWVCNKLKEAGYEFTYEQMQHFYSPIEKNYR